MTGKKAWTHITVGFLPFRANARNESSSSSSLSLSGFSSPYILSPNSSNFSGEEPLVLRHWFLICSINAVVLLSSSNLKTSGVGDDAAEKGIEGRSASHMKDCFFDIEIDDFGVDTLVLEDAKLGISLNFGVEWKIDR